MSFTAGPSMFAGPNRLARLGLWLVLANVLFFHVLRRLVGLDGAGDGSLYAGIARNLAEGQGSLWDLNFSQHFFSGFTEHPPLMIWIEAGLFRLFGDTLVVEKAFSFFLLLLNGAFIVFIWRQLSRGSRYQNYDVVALILTLVAGRIGYAFASSLIENLQMAFTAFAVLCVVIAYQDGMDRRHRFFLMFCSGALIELALLTKGPVGLFPLATPLLYFTAFRAQRFTDVVLDMAIIASTFIVLSLAILAFTEPREYFVRYLNIQVVASLAGARGGEGLFGSLGLFLPIFLFPCLIAFFIWALSFFSGPTDSVDRMARGSLQQNGFFLFAVGFSASAPILLSHRVAAYYFNPSIPFFAMALVCGCAPHLLNITSRLSETVLRRAVACLAVLFIFATFVVVRNVGDGGDHRDSLRDAGTLAESVCKPDATCTKPVYTCESVYYDYEFHAFLGRKYRIELINEIPVSMNALFLIDNKCALPKFAQTSERTIGLLQHKLYEVKAD